ncbi:uncharacterized protein LOC113239699 [Hyposmocoma kahamanoa]|uniref:uncharacterized protein LOC113239699 n=1 Tax=Hyposmocoma kahamanoa TaxID=1477025 RepID=UPI000E6D5E53|nr:uncharacterized protein LOC113239699 [Hyposmocoma kahamanoa]
MLIEIPVFKRACFCVPLRYGIIILGYLNVVISIFYVVSERMLGGMHRGVPIPAPFWVFFLVYAAEIIFSVVLVIGAHKKLCILLNAFYYYSLSTTLVAFVCLLVVWGLYHNVLLESDTYLELTIAFSSFAVHIYLLLLIRSEVKKLSNCNSYVVVNHMSEVAIEQPKGEGRNAL